MSVCVSAFTDLIIINSRVCVSVCVSAFTDLIIITSRVCVSVVQRQIKGDCVDMEPAAKQRGDVVVSFLLILKKARQHHIGPSLRSVVHPPVTDVCKYLTYRSVRVVHCCF